MTKTDGKPGPNPLTKSTPKKDEIFFRALADGIAISVASKTAGLSREQCFNRRNEDESFAARWKAAQDQAIERMETEADRRAIEGTKKPVFYKGIECGYVREFSDMLLMFRLNGLKPDVYRQHSTVKLQGSLKIEQIKGDMPEEEAARVWRDMIASRTALCTNN